MRFEFIRWPMRARRELFVALALSLVLMACGGGGGSNSTAAGAMSAQNVNGSDLLMRSQQTSCSYEHVYITVESLRLRQEGIAGQPWREVVLTTPRRIDLLTLPGGLLEAVGAPPLTPGHYTEIRLVLADTANDSPANAIQLADGNLVPLQVPGGSSSGLKLDGDFDVPVPRSADVVLEGFDPCQAVVRAGNSGRYLLKPQLDARVLLLPTTQVAVPGGGFAVVVLAADAVYVQRYSAQGEVAGSQVRIDREGIVVGYAGTLVVTPLATGGYALSWLGPALTGSPLPPYPVMVRIYDSSGNPLAAAQQVGTTQSFKSPVVQWAPPVAAALTGGGYVIAWAETQGDLLSQPFDAAGDPIGASRVSGLGGLNIRVVGLASGGYMLVSALVSIGARAYAADGTELGPPRTVVADTGWTPFSSIDVALAALADGGAMVNWSTATAGQPSQSFAQRLAADASPVGNPVQVQ